MMSALATEAPAICISMGHTPWSKHIIARMRLEGAIADLKTYSPARMSHVSSSCSWTCKRTP